MEMSITYKVKISSLGFMVKDFFLSVTSMKRMMDHVIFNSCMNSAKVFDSSTWQVLP